MSFSGKQRVLNQTVGGAPPPSSSPRPPSELALELQRTMLHMKGEYMTEDGKGVNYEMLTHSELFERYQSLTRELEYCDPSQLNDEERKAFFISILHLEILSLEVFPCTGIDFMVEILVATDMIKKLIAVLPRIFQYRRRGFDCVV